MSNVEKIESYVHGNMTDHERGQFEALLVKDSELRQELAAYQAIGQALEMGMENHLRDHLNELATSPTKTVSTTRPLWKQPWLMAASIIGILSVAYWLILPHSNESFIADNHYEQFEFNQSRGVDLPSNLAKGFKLIEENKISEATAHFIKELEIDPENYTAHFILGDLYRQRNLLSDARNHMKIILDGKSLIWREKAQVNYLILSTQLDWDDTSEGILLEVLDEENHPFRSEAIAIKDIISKRQ